MAGSTLTKNALGIGKRLQITSSWRVLVPRCVIFSADPYKAFKLLISRLLGHLLLSRMRCNVGLMKATSTVSVCAQHLELGFCLTNVENRFIICSVPEYIRGYRGATSPGTPKKVRCQ